MKNFEHARFSSYGEARSWKSKRKTQYRCGKRGKKHSIVLDQDREFKYGGDHYKLECYLEKHDIPYRVEHLYKKCYKDVLRTKEWSPVKYEQQWYWTIREGKMFKQYTGMGWSYDWIEIEPYTERRTYSIYKGTRVTWWYDKDIGLEYII